MSVTNRLAAIDIGTVTTRLLVADVDEDGIREVERSTDITHLGEGLSATGRLGDAAMGRVEVVIARYAETMRDAGVERFTAMATSASRDAENGRDFVRDARRATASPRPSSPATRRRSSRSPARPTGWRARGCWCATSAAARPSWCSGT